MKSLLSFINDGRKNLKPYERNLFFAVTVFIVILNVVLFDALGGTWTLNTDNFITDASQLAEGLGGRKSHWHDRLYFTSLLQTFLNSFLHSTWQHALLNMLCFAVCGVYLERKMGSLYFFVLIVFLAFFGSCATAANNNSMTFRGFSGVNFSLYAYILIDYIFLCCRKNERNKFRLIYGGVMHALIYFATCFNGDANSVRFSPFPNDLLYNLGHYTGYFVGLIFGLTVNAVSIVYRRKYALTKEEITVI